MGFMCASTRSQVGPRDSGNSTPESSIRGNCSPVTIAARLPTCLRMRPRLPDVAETVAVSNETDHPMDLAALNHVIAAAVATWT